MNRAPIDASPLIWYMRSHDLPRMSGGFNRMRWRITSSPQGARLSLDGLDRMLMELHLTEKLHEWWDDDMKVVVAEADFPARLFNPNGHPSSSPGRRTGSDGGRHVIRT